MPWMWVNGEYVEYHDREGWTWWHFRTTWGPTDVVDHISFQQLGNFLAYLHPLEEHAVYGHSWGDPIGSGTRRTVQLQLIKVPDLKKLVLTYWRFKVGDTGNQADMRLALYSQLMGGANQEEHLSSDWCGDGGVDAKIFYSNSTGVDKHILIHVQAYNTGSTTVTPVCGWYLRFELQDL